MRLGGLLTGPERRVFERLVPGVDLDLVDVVSLPGRVSAVAPSLGAITIGRRIFVRPGVFEGDLGLLLDLLAHEVVHVSQWRRHGPVGFLVRYLVDYAVLRADGHGHTEAYLRIPAEEEARSVAARRDGHRAE